MKIEGHGQAKILTQEEIELLFNEGLLFDRDRTLFGVCLYTACSIAEACSLKVINVFTPAGVIRSETIIRFRQHQRQARHPHYPDRSRVEAAVRNLQKHLSHPYLFPSRHLNHRWKHANPEAASHLFQEACERVGITGASTHSLRRSALTQMSNAGIPLRIVQEISGHRNARTVAALRKRLGQNKSEERSLHFPCFLTLENARYPVGSGLLVYDERPQPPQSLPVYLPVQ
ncbi:MULTISPECIES: tyrosine-type recombinase/integrase [unclassified Microcoleus]